MYKTKDISIKELKAIEIKNQDEILERTKQKLDPVKAFEIIKNESKGFTKSDLKTEEADDLLYRLINRKEGEKSQSNQNKENANEELLIKQRERARALELLELELELNIKSA